jgi:hypothetical protein
MAGLARAGGGVLLGALFAGTTLVGAAPFGAASDAAWAASECDRNWSVTTSDGAPITSSTMFVDDRIAPGASLDGEFLVTTGSDIRGPLDLRAVRSSGAPDAVLESDLLVTLTGSSRAVTMPLSDLLAADESARVIDALTPGAHSIGVSVELPFGSPNATQITEIPFRLVVTVSEQQTVIGTKPIDCAAVPGGGSGGSAGSGGLASTGAQAGPLIAGAAALGGVGLALLVAARRRRRDPADD